MPVYYLIIPAFIIVVLLVIIFRQRNRLSAVAKNSDSQRVDTQSLPQATSIVGSDALFATLSHELKTPLNGLLGLVQMLNEAKEDEDLRAIEGCARHMLAVISTLVNHSKIQSEWDDLPEHREWVNLYELLEQLKRHLQFRADLRSLQIKLVHQDHSLRLRGDYDHLRHIFENAILGSIECVSLTELPTDKQVLTLSWKTFADSVQFNIQNPLEEYADDRQQKILTADGLTTGKNHSRIKMEYLYWEVCTMLLEKYQGTMSARSMDAGGVDTTLSFQMEQMQASPSSSLPVGGLSLDTPSTPTKAVKELPFKLSILVAEDDPIARALLSSVLSLMGQEATFATNGREVLDLVSQSRSFDMILMDIDMPIMDGMSASLALRNGEAGELGTKVPIVAVTAFSTLSDESKFKRAGMNYFLPKPVKLKHLREVILDIVRKNPTVGA